MTCWYIWYLLNLLLKKSGCGCLGVGFPQSLQKSQRWRDSGKWSSPGPCTSPRTQGLWRKIYIPHHPTSSIRFKKFAIQSIRTLIVSHSFPLFSPKINPIFLPSILPKYEKTGGTRWNRGMRIPSHTRLDDPPEFRCLSKSRHLTIDPKTSFFGLRRKEQTKPSLLKSKVAKSRVSRFISSTGTTRHDTRAEATELWELWPLEWHELHESPERAGSTGRLQNAWVWRMSILALLTDHFCWCQWSLIFEKIETPDTPHNPEKMTSPTCHSFAHSISNHSS